MANRDVYAKTFEAVISAMEAGRTPWVRPWRSARGNAGEGTASSLPFNAATGRRYSGGNVWALWATEQELGYETSGWVTFKQALSLGLVVRKGERSAPVFFMSRIVKRGKDANGEDAVDSIFFAKGYNVFNLSQLDEVEEGAKERLMVKLFGERKEAREVKGDAEAFDVLDAAEAAIAATGAAISHGGGSAYYHPALDAIKMPPRESFTHRDHYYSTLFHELAHWTGAERRLNRLTPSRFGSPDYAFEELVAELAAAFVSARFGIEMASHSGAYLRSWAKACRQHPDMFARAASLAQAAADYILKETPEAVEAAAEALAAA